MCGRFTLHSPKEFLADQFAADVGELLDLAPRYNVAPTQDVVTIRTSRSRQARLAGWMRWGLVPHWAKDRAQLPLMINARVETLTERPAYRDAFRTHRCLIPADGFYEWKDSGGDHNAPKTPMFISLAGREPFAMAGLWARWRPDADSEPLYSCTIVTAPANAAIAPVHDRMPVVLRPEAVERWLDPALDDPEELTALLEPRAPDAFRMHAVSPLVNSVDHDGPRLIERVREQASLF